MLMKLTGTAASALVVGLMLIAGASGSGEQLCLGAAPTIAGSGTIVGPEGDDVIVGSSGDDVILAGNGADRVCAGSGADDVQGGAATTCCSATTDTTRFAVSRATTRCMAGAVETSSPAAPGSTPFSAVTARRRPRRFRRRRRGVRRAGRGLLAGRARRQRHLRRRGKDFAETIGPEACDVIVDVP